MRNKEASERKRKGIRGPVRLLLVLTFLAQFAAVPCFGQPVKGIPSSIKNPQDIERWLSGFEYRMQFPDEPKSFDDILSSRAGDCDDFAKVVSKALTGLGIPNEIVVIKFRNMNVRHAICLWKAEDGNYNFFTTRTLVRTNEKTVEAAVKRYFSHYESISSIRPDIGKQDAF